MLPNSRWLAAAVFLCAIIASGTRAAAQNVYQDVQQEVYDMQRLNADRSRLNYDLSNGNLFGALIDELRIGVDQQRVQGDEMRLQYDLSRQPYGFAPLPGQTLVPHPQYPGYYYYPSNPGQLYYYPNQPPQAMPSANGPAQVQPNALPGPVSAANTASAPAISVTIRNQDSSGLSINYTVNGTPYSTANGSVQTLDVPARAQIAFDRGGAFGATRYTLAAGLYDFQITERGWDLYKQRPTPTASPFATAETSGAAANPVQNALPRRRDDVPPPPPTPATADDSTR